jgi:hypothetical protein
MADVSPRSFALVLALLTCACGTSEDNPDATATDSGSSSTTSSGGESGSPPASTSTNPTSGPGTTASSSDTESSSSETSSDTEDVGVPTTLEVRLVPSNTPSARINFAVPLPAGTLSDPARVVVTHEGSELAVATAGLSTYDDGSLRSVQIQFDLDVAGETVVEVSLGETPSMDAIELVPVEDTLVNPDGSEGPSVWAVLPATWLADSGVAGPLAAAETFDGTPAAAWLTHCDHQTWNTDAFLAVSGERGPWLYDRATTLGRAYAVTGDLAALQSQYREAGIYGMGITGAGADITIPVPEATGDAKYHYAQNLAMHYLLSGDTRFRERAEDVADRMATLWPDPGYAGGADFWTERHAGFSLLAYVAAAQVSDDRSAEFLALADTAVQAYLDVMETYPEGWDDADARCFAHHADAHGEGYGYFGCSPWMSAILADGLEQYALLRGGEQAEQARAAIVRMGRLLAREGLDAGGKPFYWMGVGTDADEVDSYDEHWGETAYVIAMAWHYAPVDEPDLRTAADNLVQGLTTQGAVPHIRSYNWQCRSAIATPYYLHGR